MAADRIGMADKFTDLATYIQKEKKYLIFRIFQHRCALRKQSHGFGWQRPMLRITHNWLQIIHVYLVTGHGCGMLDDIAMDGGWHAKTWIQEKHIWLWMAPALPPSEARDTGFSMHKPGSGWHSPRVTDNWGMVRSRTSLWKTR
jgi:hypothetical protein